MEIPKRGDGRRQTKLASERKCVSMQPSDAEESDDTFFRAKSLREDSGGMVEVEELCHSLIKASLPALLASAVIVANKDMFCNIAHVALRRITGATRYGGSVDEEDTYQKELRIFCITSNFS